MARPYRAIERAMHAPPTGWTNEEACMHRSYYWAGASGDIKDMLDTDYGLKNAEPLWTHHPQYGNVLFIFHAVPKAGKVSYYVWNGIEGTVCLIDALGVDEIRNSINKFGKGKGYLEGLKLSVVEAGEPDLGQPVGQSQGPRARRGWHSPFRNPLRG